MSQRRNFQGKTRTLTNRAAVWMFVDRNRIRVGELIRFPAVQ